MRSKNSNKFEVENEVECEVQNNKTLILQLIALLYTRLIILFPAIIFFVCFLLILLSAFNLIHTHTLACTIIVTYF
jgi:hypothetical protein